MRRLQAGFFPIFEARHDWTKPFKLGYGVTSFTFFSVSSVGRPRKPLISQNKAVKAALAVIDSRGLEALSLQDVAQKLGVKAPSLYHHFRDKNELLEHVARLLLLEVKVPKARKSEDWKEFLIRLGIATRREILRHPNAAPLLLQKFPRHVLLAAYDRWLGICGAPPELHLLVSEGMETIVMGSALFAAASVSAGVKQLPEFDAQKLPNLARAVESNRFDDDTMFEEIARSFLRGLSVEAIPSRVTRIRPSPPAGTAEAALPRRQKKSGPAI